MSWLAFYFYLNFFSKGCLICGRINATIFKREKNLKQVKPHTQLKNEDASDNDKEMQEDEFIQSQEALKTLTIGQNILIKIKSMQYEQNNLFLVASFVKCLE